VSSFFIQFSHSEESVFWNLSILEIIVGNILSREAGKKKAVSFGASFPPGQDGFSRFATRLAQKESGLHEAACCKQSLEIYLGVGVAAGVAVVSAAAPFLAFLDFLPW